MKNKLFSNGLNVPILQKGGFFRLNKEFLKVGACLTYITGDFTVGRKIQITSFLLLENISSSYNWTNFEFELIDENNETQGIINGNIWENVTESSFSIESRSWTSSTINRFFKIELTLPEVQLIQFKLEFWFEKKYLIPLYQDKWIFRFITDRFVIESRPLLEQIILGVTKLVTNYVERQLISRFMSFFISFVVGAILIFTRWKS